VYLNVYLCVFVYSRFIENRLVDLEATNLSFMRCFYHNGVPRRHAASKAVADWASHIAGGGKAQGLWVGWVGDLRGDSRSNGHGGQR
jgi:hypothetical protein